MVVEEEESSTVKDRVEIYILSEPNEANGEADKKVQSACLSDGNGINHSAGTGRAAGRRSRFERMATETGLDFRAHGRCVDCVAALLHHQQPKGNVIFMLILWQAGKLGPFTVTFCHTAASPTAPSSTSSTTAHLEGVGVAL